MNSTRPQHNNVENLELRDTKNNSLVEQVERVGSSPSGSDDNLPVDHGSSMNMTKWLACIALGVSYTTAIQQHSCTATIVKHIDNALGPTSYYNWIISGHNITVSLILPLAGGLSDIFGRKKFFIVGCLFSLLGTIVSLAAKDIPTIIAGMILKGIGSGSQQLAIPAIAEIVPNKHRGTAQAILDLVGLPWTVFGALIGNSMVKYYALSFRVNFIIGIILNCLTIVLIYFLYHPPAGRRAPGKSVFQELKELDWLGIFLLACGIVLTLAGIAFGGTLFPWKHPGTIVTLAVGVLSVVALGLWEWKGSRNPLFSHELFQGPNNRFGLCLILTFVAGMSLYALAAFWTQQAQAMFFSDPTKIGLSTIPSGMGGVIGGFFAGILIGKGRLFRANLILFYGAVLKLAGDIMFLFVTPDRLILGMAAGFIGMFGVGGVMIGIIVTVQLTCMDKHIGLATLVLASVRSLGGSTSVTIYSSVMTNTLKKDAPVRLAKALPTLPRETLGAFTGMLMGGKPDKALQLKGMTPAILEQGKQIIKWSWSVAFKRIYYASVAFTAVAMIVALFIKDVASNMTEHVAVELTNDHTHNDKDKLRDEA